MNEKQAIRAVFVDLDGTLLQGVDTVTPRTVAAFDKLRASGVTPVVATGRLAYEADFAMRAIEADGYMIAMNGLAVYDDYRTGHLLYEAYMSDKAASFILERLMREKVFFQAYAGNRAYCQEDRAGLICSCGMDEEHVRFFSGTQKTVADLRAYLSSHRLKVNKFFVSVGDVSQIPFLRVALNAIEGVVTLSSGEHYIEVIPEGADKRRAVRAVREAMGLTPEEIMVIGDSENDLGMFDEAVTRVAMGNACDALKAKANYIAPSNQKDGVAWALETLLLGEQPSRFSGRIEILRAEEIEASLEFSTRQYLAGDLRLPQHLNFLLDKNVEIGISDYDHYHWEQAHYHTITSEYCYLLSGETKYIDLSDGTEYHFSAGDFYILRQDTPYVQKCREGCRLLFAKVPGLNDKVTIRMAEPLQQWCADWEAAWSPEQQAQQDALQQEE